MAQGKAQPLPQRRVLPKLMACMTKQSVENMRNKLLFTVDSLDAKGIRRRRMPLHKCLILELMEAGYVEASSYLQDLLYDNKQLVAEDEIGIVTDLRKKNDYLEHIAQQLQTAEREHERNNIKKECLTLLKLAMHYAELGKGILWLAEKFYLAAIAVGSRFLLDGGRLKNVCKYHYAKFLLDKFPESNNDEAFSILTEVRDAAIGKTWPLYEAEREGQVVPPDLLFRSTATQLHRVLLTKSSNVRGNDIAKAERLARLAERRGMDSKDIPQIAEAIIEVGICQLMMNNLNNAKKTFERAFKLNTEIQNTEGLCITRMHLAAVYQRLGQHETSARLLTEMGELAMTVGLRRQLARALHLLGELHLRRERPDLGTHHLTEAFFCALGATVSVKLTGDAEGQPDALPASEQKPEDAPGEPCGEIYTADQGEMYFEEAEQSRFMMAVSAGQELMASYFNILKDAKVCSVATVKVIEWKLAKIGWWVRNRHDDFQPCLCPQHNRTPLDVLQYELKLRREEEERKLELEAAGDPSVPAFDSQQQWVPSVENIQLLRSGIFSEK